MGGEVWESTKGGPGHNTLMQKNAPRGQEVRATPRRKSASHHKKGVKQTLVTVSKIGLPGETGGETSRVPGGFDITGVLFLVKLSSQETTLWVESPPAHISMCLIPLLKSATHPGPCTGGPPGPEPVDRSSMMKY